MPKKGDLFAQIQALLEANSGGEEVTIDESAVETQSSRYADSPSVFVHYPAGFRPNVCKTCGRGFGTNRRAVGFCSDVCRKEDWRKTMLIPWSAISTNDPWYGEPPLIITPDQFDRLAAIAEWFNKNQGLLDTARQRWIAENSPEPEEEEPEPLPVENTQPSEDSQTSLPPEPVASTGTQTDLEAWLAEIL